MTQLRDSAESARIAMVEYRVLGSLSAHVDGTPRKLGGKRQRAVLASLLTHPNTVISQDSLIDAVWAGDSPATAAQTLHTYVSTLRKTLDGAIERDGEGYVLRVDRANLDSLRFEDLVAEARGLLDGSPARAAALLEEALALWHGPAFGDLGGEPSLANEAIRLEEARLQALEQRIEADLALGNHASVVQELEALTREHPYREHLRGLLMLALYRSGRQADALRVYRQTRIFLAEELGIDPSPEIQALEEKILTQDPRLDWQEIRGEATTADRAARGYELREEIAESPMGVTHRAFQGSIGREVAVLHLRESVANDPEFVRRFESEMQAVSRLEHPHIVPLYDYWRDPAGAYLVTAYLSGGTLRQALGDGPWNLSSTLRLVDQVTSSLDYAQRHGFTHGAIGVDTIGLDEDSNAYVLGYGLTPFSTTEAAGRGIEGDVADLSMVAYTMLTGEAAAEGQRISESRPDLSALDFVFSRAFHPDPASRYDKPEDLRRALRQAAGTDVVVGPSQAPAESQRRNPYKGLRAFHESDAADFHGRDALVEEMIEALAVAQFVAVVGPSGSGKSSLVRAGLVPALRIDAIEGSGLWLITEMFPGTHPFEELEAALLRVAVDRPSGLVNDLTADARGLARVVKQTLPGEDGELILIVDQFEELFSMVPSETDRRLFLDSLVAAATDERSRVRVIITLRADFFDQPLQYAGFGDLLRQGLVPVGPPTEDGLARAIAQPARDVGVDVEPGLVTRMVDDVRQEPGGLPLLQYALTELFAAREHNTMTVVAYEKTGGVLGALGKRAEEIYQGLPKEGKEATRHLFLRLVTVDELADDTRRRVRQTELKRLGINQAVLDDVIQQFGAFRLLSFDRDGATRTPTVEVAHEALIREWPRLRTWIDDRREDLLIHRRIQMTAQDWEDSDEDPSYLLRGSRLEQALIWQERTDIAISEDEMTLIEASIEEEKREEAEREALEEKAARRRRSVVGVLAGGLVVAGVLGAVALNRAQAERLTAAEATARDLSSAALLAVEEDPELGILLALEAIKATEAMGLEPVPEAASALRDTLRTTRIERRIPSAFGAIAYSPDGAAIATDDEKEPGVIHLWQEDQESPVATWNWVEAPSPLRGEVTSLGFAPDGSVLAASWTDHPGYVMRAEFEPVGPDTIAAVSLHNAYTLESETSLMGERGYYWEPTFGASGLVAAVFVSLANEGKAYVWDTESGEVLHILESETSITATEFIPGTNTLVTSHASGTGDDDTSLPSRLIATDVATSEEEWSLATPDLDAHVFAISKDGSKAAVADLDQKWFQVWDLEAGELLADAPHDDPEELTWSPDGSLLAVSGDDGDITVLAEARSWGPALILTGHQASVWSTAFHPSGEYLVSASLDGSALVWDVTEAGAVGDWAVATGGRVGQFFLGPDDGRLIAGEVGVGPKTIHASTGVVDVSLPLSNGFHFLPNQHLTTVAGYIGLDEDRRGVLVDGRTGRELHTFADCLLPLAISPDEELVVVDSVDVCGDRSELSSRLFDITTGEMLIDLGPRRLFKAFFSPDGTFDGHEYVVVNVENLVIEIYSLDDFELIASFSSTELDVPSFLTLDIDPDGRHVGLGTNGPQAVVIDMVKLLSGVPKMEAVAFNKEVAKANVPQVRVTSDGVVVSAGFDDLYRVWDVATGELLFELRVPGIDGQGAAQFTWDNKQLAYEDDLGNIRFTPLDTKEVVARAEAALTRELTDDECTQYLHTDGCQ